MEVPKSFHTKFSFYDKTGPPQIPTTILWNGQSHHENYPIILVQIGLRDYSASDERGDERELYTRKIIARSNQKWGDTQKNQSDRYIYS